MSMDSVMQARNCDEPMIGPTLHSTHHYSSHSDDELLISAGRDQLW